MGDIVRLPVVEIRVGSLLLPSIHTIIIKDAVFVPSVRTNLIFVSTLDKCGYTFDFGNGNLLFILILLMMVMGFCIMVYIY